MCEECFRLFHDLRDQEIACSTEGCGRTWKFTTYAQLEHLLTNGADAPVPTRLCGKCFGFMQHAHDRQMPCLNRGCPNTWSYTREMQLQDRIHDRVPEPRRCAMCEQRIAETQDREIPCSVAGCTNAWNYSAEEQVRDACNGRTTPPEKRCRACEEFLASHEAQSVPCPHCGRQIAWSAYEQLLCERGTFVRPSMCVDCAEQQMAIREPVETEQQHAHHHVVRMPSSGRWHADPATTDWPPHLTHDIIAEVELADVRIVALGDDLTYSSEDRDSSWPKLLQEALTRLLDGRSVSVVNAGMPGTTTAQAVVRFARDVQPFAPHLTLVSFCFRDSFIRPGTEGEAQTGRAEEAVAAMHKLCGLLRRRTPGKAMYWVPNPSYPHDADVRGFSASWANAQEAARRQLMVQEGHVCQEYGIPVLDLRSRFEVNGKKSALKWMCDWFRHNETGARNIATWMAQYIVRENLLDA
jgi:lysophospholipase L1-like esterase